MSMAATVCPQVEVHCTYGPTAAPASSGGLGRTTPLRDPACPMGFSSLYSPVWCRKLLFQIVSSVWVRGSPPRRSNGEG